MSANRAEVDMDNSGNSRNSLREHLSLDRLCDRAVTPGSVDMISPKSFGAGGLQQDTAKASVEEEAVKSSHFKKAFTVPLHISAKMDPTKFSPFRHWVFNTFASPACEAFLTMVILFNVIVIVAETDRQSAELANPALDTDALAWTEIANYSLMLIYGTELVLRLYAFRSHFFMSMANIMDALIIITDIVFQLILKNLIMGVSVLRMFRLLRLGRAVRVLVYFPELGLMIQGMSGAFKSIFWGMLLITMILTGWSIIAVHLIHPLNLDLYRSGQLDTEDCKRCHRAFETVFASLVTFIQTILTGDSWGSAAVPIIEKYPMTLMYFVSVIASVTMGIMNLILSTIVDSAAEARKSSEVHMVAIKEAKYRAIALQLQDMCIDLDKDNDGQLALEELMKGYAENPEFKNLMTMMDIEEGDIKTIFQILDEDSSGSVAADEFVKQLYKMRSDDDHTMLVFIRFYMQEVLNRTARVEHHLKEVVMSDIGAIVEERMDSVLRRVKITEAGEFHLSERTKGTDAVFVESEKSMRKTSGSSRGGTNRNSTKKGSSPAAAPRKEEPQQANSVTVQKSTGSLETAPAPAPAPALAPNPAPATVLATALADPIEVREPPLGPRAGCLMCCSPVAQPGLNGDHDMVPLPCEMATMPTVGLPIDYPQKPASTRILSVRASSRGRQVLNGIMGLEGVAGPREITPGPADLSTEDPGSSSYANDLSRGSSAPQGNGLETLEIDRMDNTDRNGRSMQETRMHARAPPSLPAGQAAAGGWPVPGWQAGSAAASGPRQDDGVAGPREASAPGGRPPASKRTSLQEWVQL